MDKLATAELDRDFAKMFGELGLDDFPTHELQEIASLSKGDIGALRRLSIRKLFGEPNAYLRGKVTMLGRTFRVDRRCYIPDQYADELVRRVIKDAPPGASVLEVGTGCGWIATSLKLERPDMNIVASDIDPGAISVARENAAWHGVSIPFYESYFVDDVPIPAPDIIVANIPYGGDFDYTNQELEERPQMPSIALCDPGGVVKPLVEFHTSIVRKRWASKIYLETGYLPKEKLQPVTTNCEKFEHVQNGEYGYLVFQQRGDV